MRNSAETEKVEFRIFHSVAGSLQSNHNTSEWYQVKMDFGPRERIRASSLFRLSCNQVIKAGKSYEVKEAAVRWAA